MYQGGERMIGDTNVRAMPVAAGTQISTLEAGTLVKINENGAPPAGGAAPRAPTAPTTSVSSTPVVATASGTATTLVGFGPL